MSWEGKECPPWGPEPQVRKCSSDSGTGRLSMGEGSVVFKDFLDMTNWEDSFHASIYTPLRGRSFVEKVSNQIGQDLSKLIRVNKDYISWLEFLNPKFLYTMILTYYL